MYSNDFPADVKGVPLKTQLIMDICENGINFGVSAV